MTSEMNFDVQASSGEVNASLPIHVSTVTPDGVRLGEPFTIETSWSLDDAASMWGETFMLDGAIQMDLEGVALGIHYEIGDDTGKVATRTSATPSARCRARSTATTTCWTRSPATPTRSATTGKGISGTTWRTAATTC